MADQPNVTDAQGAADMLREEYDALEVQYDQMAPGAERTDVAKRLSEIADRIRELNA